MAEAPGQAAAARTGSNPCCMDKGPLELARNDREVLLQLVEASLFVRGEPITEGDIADGMGIPVAAVREALQLLARRYESHDGAIRVREIDEGLWLMDLHEEISEHVETFYLEDKPCTRSEIMTLAFIAFAQPVPKQVVNFYRGKSAGSHARKLVEAGFVKEESIDRADSRLKDIVSRYQQDLAERLAETGEHSPSQEEGQQQDKKKPDAWLDRASYTCYATTSRFCGYFNLPRDVESMKKQLENWKDIYGLFD